MKLFKSIPFINISQKNTTDKIPCIVVQKQIQINELFYYDRVLYDKSVHQYLFKKYKFTIEQAMAAETFTDDPFGVIAYVFGQFVCQEKINNSLQYNNNWFDIQVLDSLTKPNIGIDLTVNAGLDFDPRNFMSKSNHIHLPSFTITTINELIDKDMNGNHILKIKLKATDTGVYLDKISAKDREREILLPRNTTIKILESNTKGNIIEHIAIIDNNINKDRIKQNLKTIMPMMNYKFLNFYKNNDQISQKLKRYINSHENI